MTGRELLRFCAGVRGIAGLGRAEELAGRFHADLDKRGIGELSRGNRQKIGLVGACSTTPSCWCSTSPRAGSTR